MSRALRVASVLVFASLFSACGPQAPSVDCTTATLVPYSQLSIMSLCTSCHSSTVTGSKREGAPGDVNYDSYAAAKSHASSGAAQVNGGEMPPSGEPQPTAEQKTALYAWAACGTPQ